LTCTAVFTLTIPRVSGGAVVAGLAATCADQFGMYKGHYNYTSNPLACLILVLKTGDFVNASTVFVHFFASTCTVRFFLFSQLPQFTSRKS
jgi:hypothetical protein